MMKKTCSRGSRNCLAKWLMHLSILLLMVMLPVPDAEGSAKRNRPCTSDVWDEYEKIYKVVNGKRIRFQAKCIHCGKVYAALSTFDTGTLKRHLLACSAKMQKCHSSQSLLQFNPNGTLGHWEYSPEVARTQLCRLIARLDLPLGFGDSEIFEEYIKIAHNPRFASVSWQTTTRDLAKYYADCRSKVMDTLAATSSVAFTSDIWSVLTG
ncbi:hypothetical protein PVAP13_2KG060416 [Panicum virgatum]|uniref:BED-type domain-containing protein n=1 Tax=Panicum virgatum TaxID=38727 RepID=A0A8T0VVU1_PANVG|nr:hypothetical protein PVAP13_2KG060416 [Panicum virgatum]